MKKLKEKEIISGIRNGDAKIIERIYQECFGCIRNLVMQNSGSLDEARDLFQDVLVVVCERARKDSFRLTCSFRTYIYAIARNIWFRRVENRNKELPLKIEVKDERYVPDGRGSGKLSVEEMQMLLYQKHYCRMSENCKQVLRMLLQRSSTAEIMDFMGYSSIAYTRKRKYQCKESLIRRIHEDPEYQELQEEQGCDGQESGATREERVKQYKLDYMANKKKQMAEQEKERKGAKKDKK